MRKSILVIETPKTCENCYMLSHNYCNFQCLITGELIEKSTNRPNWCPLKPLPEKNTTENDMTDYQCGMVDGRNQCIDEITGGNVDD